MQGQPGTTWTSTQSPCGTSSTNYYAVETDDPYPEFVTTSGEYSADEVEIRIIITWLIIWAISAYQIILRRLIEQRTRGPPPICYTPQ